MHFDKTLDQTERHPVGPQDLKSSRAALFRLWGQINPKDTGQKRTGRSDQSALLRVADRPLAPARQTANSDHRTRWRAEIEADNFEFWS